MFQPNSLRALRDLKLDKELEKNAIQFQQSSEGEKGSKKIRSLSSADPAIQGAHAYDSSDISEDEDEEEKQEDLLFKPFLQNEGNTSKEGEAVSNMSGLKVSGLMSNSSEYFSKMKQLLEKNPYHPMNFIFDHKDLLQELNQFIKETREWRETQKEDLEQQLQSNKQRAVVSVEQNEEMQKKVKEQIEFEKYLEGVQQVQENYQLDMQNYSRYIPEANKENFPIKNNDFDSFTCQNENKELLKLIEDSKQKVSNITNMDEYLQRAQMEVDFNKSTVNMDNQDRQNLLNQNINALDLNDGLIEDISQWEQQIDELLLNLKEDDLDQSSMTSKQRIQSARQNLKKEYTPTKDQDIEKELQELDKEFEELEKILQSVRD